MKKKILSLVLILMLVGAMFVLTGCGEVEETSTSPNSSSSESSDTTESEISQEEIFYGTEVVEGDGSNVGDIVTCGGEEFYVISNDGTNIKMLAKYNLYVGNYHDEGDGMELHAYSELEATGIQNSTMLAGSSGRAEGITKFIGSGFKGENSSDYEGSLVEKYVNEYKEYLIEKANLEESEVSASIITIEELESLGCSLTEESCGDAPEWVYSTNYWTKTKPVYSSGEATDILWAVKSDGSLTEAPVSAIYLGVRPVITISTSSLES